MHYERKQKDIQEPLTIGSLFGLQETDKGHHERYLPRNAPTWGLVYALYNILYEDTDPRLYAAARRLYM